MPQIETLPFGQTGHHSTRTIFGSFALKDASPDQSAQVLDLLYRYGVNHIDTAPSYGDAELRVGEWMAEHRQDFFLATKIDVNDYQGAKEQFQRSLNRLQVDSVDLLQLHNLTDEAQREFVLAEGGAFEYLLEAKEKGFARFIGITGHGLKAPLRHLETLERCSFDSVLAPCNYLLLKKQEYADSFGKLHDSCRRNGLALQTIKSTARRKYPGQWTHATWYQPLSDTEAIKKAVTWVLGIPDVFLVTTGDVTVLPHILSAAAEYDAPPSDAAMGTLVQEQEMEPLFT
ncbi:MAG: aldo/keto reductase [Desulfovermiculus sp.]|nr:aldo/keto reductase [Desulfovermiculus sp.]